MQEMFYGHIDETSNQGFLRRFTLFCCKEILVTIPHGMPRADIANLHSNLSLCIPRALFMAGFVIHFSSLSHI